MPTLAATFVQRLRPAQLLTAQALVDQHLQGVPLVLASGQPFAPEAFDEAIQAAQRAVEAAFSLLLIPQVVEETRDLDRQLFLDHGYLKTTYPVVAPVSLKGGLGATQALEYPAQWLTARQTSDRLSYERAVAVIPNGGASLSGSFALAFTGLALSSFWNRDLIPHFWKLRYRTGFEQVPADLVQLVGRLAALAIYYQLAGVVLGPGLASLSLSLDGLSQSVSASNPYAAVVKGYEQAITEARQSLQGVYGAFSLHVL